MSQEFISGHFFYGLLWTKKDICTHFFFIVVGWVDVHFTKNCKNSVKLECYVQSKSFLIDVNN